MRSLEITSFIEVCYNQKLIIKPQMINTVNYTIFFKLIRQYMDKYAQEGDYFMYSQVGKILILVISEI